MSDDLRDLEVRQDNLEAKIEQAVMKRLERHEEELDSLRETVATLKTENQELRSDLDSLVGLADDQESTPQKRAADLRHKLQNVARNRDSGMVSWTYREVRDQLEGVGHENIYAAQAYDAMKDAAEYDEDTNTSHADGFAYIKNDDGQWTIRVNMNALPAHAAVNENNNAAGESPVAAEPNHGD